MPRDEWAASHRRDAARRATNQTAYEDRKKSLVSKKKWKRIQNPKRIASRWSSEGKLWFGKYRDVAIKDIPLDYLNWLVQSHEPGKLWRMDGLCAFLKLYVNRSVE